MYPPRKPRYVYPKQTPPRLPKANPATFTLKANPATCTLQANPATFIQSKPRHVCPKQTPLRLPSKKTPLHVPSKQTPLRLSKANPAMHLYSGSGCALGNTLASHNGCGLKGSLPHQDLPWKIAIGWRWRGLGAAH